MMRTFPVYDTEVSRSENWDMLNPARAFKKKANWIPFLKVIMRKFPFSVVLVLTSTKIHFSLSCFF